jgi:hypothetical protein
LQIARPECFTKLTSASTTDPIAGAGTPDTTTHVIVVVAIVKVLVVVSWTLRLLFIVFAAAYSFLHFSASF